MAPSQSSEDAGQPETLEDDVFASILSLEEDYHNEGYNLGVADGARAGRIEGRQFGLEKGLAKALEMGRLRGRACVWSARSSCSTPASAHGAPQIASLEKSARTQKHIERLVELTDPASLETRNSEEAVQEFEERLGGARTRLILIRKIVDEDGSVQLDPKESSTPRTVPHRSGQAIEMEDFLSLSNSRGIKN
nr:protein oraov1 like [Quercus suber]